MLRTLVLSAAFILATGYAQAQSLPHASQQSARPATCGDFHRYPSASWRPLFQVVVSGRVVDAAAAFEKLCRTASPRTPLRAFIKQQHPVRAGRELAHSEARS